MPSRTQIFQQRPWTGGTNSSVDPGMIGPNDLQQADNVVFGVSGVRTKRQGFDYFDTDLPAVSTRSSTGTTRTLVFASAITGGSPNDSLIVVGEKLSISNAGNANYNTDAAIVASVSGSTITYTFSGASSLSESSTAATSTTVVRNYDILGHIDFWYYDNTSHAKVQELVAATSQGLIFKYDSNGRRTQIVMSGSGATALAADPTAVDLRAFANKLIITLTGYGNTPKYYDPMVANEWKDLPGAPDGSIMMEHIGRLFMNDKAMPDRLHYCETFDETKWQGVGDSGALDVAQEDSDPNGITCIQPPFKGLLVVSKGNRTWKVTGDAPENFFAVEMSSGVGSVAHKAAVAFDTEDQFFVSRRGVHSLAATDNYGDLQSQYASVEIQNTFNEWATDNLDLIQGVYLSRLNSVAWIVAEAGQSKPNSVWLHNPTIQHPDGRRGVWYRWPNLNATSISRRLHSSTERITIGTNRGRILMGQNGAYSDNDASYTLRIKSGSIYPDGRIDTVKGFKRLGLIYKPQGEFNFTVYFTVDDYPAQSIAFDQHVQGDILGTTLTLGSSVLGSAAPLANFWKDVVGHGRSCTIEVFQSSAGAQVEIYGFMIEYEPEDSQERVDSSSETA